MVFKVIFVDGTAEIVHANSARDARLYAIKHFRERVVAAVRAAGLTDMSGARRGGAADQRTPK